jgi:hypothetical protein
MNRKFLRGAGLFVIALGLSNLAFLAQVKAVDPSDTFYGLQAGNGGTTGIEDSAFGHAALYSVTTGSFNTASGSGALEYNTDGAANTASGTLALNNNTSGGYNTANGVSALRLNIDAGYNTASGAGALEYNTIGGYNTADGAFALQLNHTGASNTASGYYALLGNITGSYNTASGVEALRNNNDGGYNTASGAKALYSNTGGFNTGTGAYALYSNIGGSNTATGVGALFSNSSGANNAALGFLAGFNLTTGSGNVCIGQGVSGVAGESNTTRIRNVYTTVANGRAVYVNADNKIGTLSSSRRFKQDIQPMDKSSETLFALKPVTFRYKKETDPSQALSFGLIAEEVAQVSPELITRDEEGKPQTVRYEAVNAMLLNEFLKEHSKVEQQAREVQEDKAMIAELKSTIAQQQNEFQSTIAQQKNEFQATIAALSERIKEQDGKIQRVSARIDLNRATPQLTANR